MGKLTHCHAQHGCIRAFEDETCGEQGQCSIVLDIDAAVAQARQDAADARANFLTMQGSAAQLLDRLLVARRVIREMTCPRPANDRPDEFTAGQCFDCGECGCHVHAVLSQQAPE